MSDKIPYVFRQNSDFMYLTGCLEPETTLVMWINEAKSIRSAMFMKYYLLELNKIKLLIVFLSSFTVPRMHMPNFGMDRGLEWITQRQCLLSMSPTQPVSFPISSKSKLPLFEVYTKLY